MGMPPFLALILTGLAPQASKWLIGWLYIVPTACLAISAPFWGRLADRWGRKPLLLRAQIGLAISFVVAGLAGSLPLFVFALCLQGLLGGTFSASNAYLSEVLPRKALAQSLNLTQASARLALIVAPAAVGLLVDRHITPQKVYLVIAVLPMLATLLLLPMPARGPTGIDRPNGNTKEDHPAKPYARAAIMAWQTGFTLAMISTFPFLVPYSMDTFDIGASAAGVLFGLPHIVYLFACMPFGRFMRDGDAAPWFALGAAIVGLMLLAQAFITSLNVFVVSRLLLGVGMTLGYVALNALIAATIEQESAGRTFGWFDSGAKLATIAASVGGGLIAAGAGMMTLFAAAGLCGLLTAAMVLVPRRPSSEAPATAHD